MNTTRMPHDLVIKLLAEELRCTKLFDTLETLGWSECWCRPDLGEVIMTLLYGTDRSEHTLDHYFTVISAHSVGLEPGQDSAEYHARMAYRALVDRQ